MSQPLSTALRTAPTVVTASFWLWIASTVLSLIAFAVLVPGLFAGTPDASGIAAGSVVGALIGSALRVFLALFLLRGANWARIVLSIIGAVVLLTGIPSLLTGDLLGLLVVLVVVVAAVLMWLPAARPHFHRA